MFIKRQNESMNTQETQSKDKKKLVIGLVLLSVAFTFGVISYITVFEDETNPPPPRAKPMSSVNNNSVNPPNVNINNTNNNLNNNNQNQNNLITSSNQVINSSSSSPSSENVITPNTDVKLVGDLVKQAVEEVVKQQIDAMKEQLKQEIKSTATSNANTDVKGKINLPPLNDIIPNPSNSNKVDVSLPDTTLPNKIFVFSKVLLPNGEIILKEKEGNVIAKGEKYKGYDVINVDEKYVYLERKEGKKVIHKEISYTVMLGGS